MSSRASDDTWMSTVVGPKTATPPEPQVRIRVFGSPAVSSRPSQGFMAEWVQCARAPLMSLPLKGGALRGLQRRRSPPSRKGRRWAID